MLPSFTVESNGQGRKSYSIPQKINILYYTKYTILVHSSGSYPDNVMLLLVVGALGGRSWAIIENVMGINVTIKRSSCTVSFILVTSELLGHLKLKGRPR